MFDEVVTVAFEIIGLQMQMLSYYKAAAVSRGHDEDTGFLLPKGGHGRSCFVVGNVYGMSCIGGMHVFRMAYLIICYVLLKDMSY